MRACPGGWLADRGDALAYQAADAQVEWFRTSGTVFPVVGRVFSAGPVQRSVTDMEGLGVG